MTACGPHGQPEHGQDDCLAEVLPPGRIVAPLICYLPEHETGDHWDAYDRVHWHVAGDGQVITTPCEAHK